MSSAITVRGTDNPALVYLASLSTQASRSSMRSALNVVARLLEPSLSCDTFPWHRLRFQHVAAIRTKLAELYAPATVNKMLSALRGVIKNAWRLGLIDTEAYTRTVDVKGVQGYRVPSGRCLSDTEVESLLNSCTNSAMGKRNFAMISLMVKYGLRRSEVTSLNYRDYDPNTGSVLVHGKGNKERIVYDVLDALLPWIAVRGDEAGPMFCPINRSGKMLPKRLSTQGIYDILGRIMVELDIEFTPHDLRRTFVSNALRSGVDIHTVAQIVGHSSVQTTARYDRRGEDSKLAALENMYK